MQTQVNLTPIRMIRRAKDLSGEEMANFFMVTRAYISAIENGKREMELQTLKSGLDNMGISLDNYFQLEAFGQELLHSELTDRDKYKFMLTKTLGIVSQELRIRSEELLQEYYYKKPITYQK